MSNTPEHDPFTTQPGAAPQQPQHAGTPGSSDAAFNASQPTVPLPEAEAFHAPNGSAAEPSYDPAHQAATEAQPAFAQPAPAPGVYGQPAPEQPAFGRQPPYAAAPSAEVAGSPSKNRAGMLLTGLAIGALLGGVVGGGVAAIVSSNSSNPATAIQGGGTLTLNNSETGTAISGVAAVATPSVVTLEVSNGSTGGSGSGVIYSEDGYIITNAHVVTLDGASGVDSTVRVKLSDGRILPAEIVGVDPYADLAVVKVDAQSLPAIAIADSDNLNVGDLAIAIGAPMNLANTVTSGVVSATNRGISVGSPLIPQGPQQDQPEQRPDDNGGGRGLPWDFDFGMPNQDPEQAPQPQTGGTVTLPVIQTDASINPGNSGGALLNDSGELIGINVAIASPTGANGTASSAGLGFAIPSNLATRVADALIAGEQPSHGLLGATVGDSSQDTDADANRAGGLVIDLVSGGAAEKAGLKSGDVITAVGGVPATDGTSVSALVRMHAGGSEVTIDYTRNGEPGKTTAMLGQLEW